MSDYGIKIKNNLGDIIIDDKYRNYAFHASGSEVATWAGDGYTNYGVMVLVSFTAIPDTQMPLVAIQPATNRFVNLIGYHKTGSNWDGFYIQVGLAGEASWENATINYKIFVAGLAAASGTYGMRIYNEAGSLIFDSNRKYFNIGQVNNITMGDPSGSGSYAYVDVSHASISDPYYFISPMGYYHGTSCAGAWIQRNAGLKKLSSTSVRVGWNSIWLSEPEGSDASYNPTLILITIPS